MGGTLVEGLKTFLIRVLSPLSYRAFIDRLAPGASLLDIGCGNNSPYKVKTQRPDIYYVGLDVVDYNQAAQLVADEYHLVPASEFALSIRRLNRAFDAVISSHNIEHCVDPGAVIDAIGSVLKPGGTLYMSFPSEASAGFPSRAGCLNFYDDPTHRDLPRFSDIIGKLRGAGCEMVAGEQRYRPALLRAFGMVQEPFSRLSGRALYATWSFYGFESVIWARKS